MRPARPCCCSKPAIPSCAPSSKPGSSLWRPSPCCYGSLCAGFADVLLTLVPLLVVGVVTLELCVVLDLPLNFANIIALPLLLGVGVAFKIYYIMAWRGR